jgi:hypothetical protein
MNALFDGLKNVAAMAKNIPGAEELLEKIPGVDLDNVDGMVANMKGAVAMAQNIPGVSDMMKNVPGLTEAMAEEAPAVAEEPQA